MNLDTHNRAQIQNIKIYQIHIVAILTLLESKFIISELRLTLLDFNIYIFTIEIFKLREWKFVLLESKVFKIHTFENQYSHFHNPKFHLETSIFTLSK